MVELLDESANLTGTRAEPQRPATLVAEDTGELGGLTSGREVVVPGAVRAAAVDHEAGRRGLDASERGAGFEGVERGVHGRTMHPVA